jgi:hypothetical protein
VTQVKQHQEFASSISDTLQAYENANRVKSTVRHQEFEDRYYIPLQMRIRERMVGKSYEEYLQTKKRLVREMDARPVPIRSARRLPPIAQISVSEAGLHDPKNRYLEQAFKQDRLSRIVNEANDIQSPEKKTPGAKSLDSRALEVLHQTRFFFGTDPEMGNRKGRKVFQRTGRSTVGVELAAFSDA